MPNLTVPSLFALIASLRDANPIGSVTGAQLHHAAIERGLVDPGDSGLGSVARLVGQLMRDGAVELERTPPRQQKPPTWFDGEDLSSCYDVRPKALGYQVFSPGGSALTISGPVAQLVVGGQVTNVQLVHVLEDLEGRLDAEAAPEEEKAKVRRWLSVARETLADSSSSVAAKLLAEMLTRGM